MKLSTFKIYVLQKAPLRKLKDNTRNGRKILQIVSHKGLVSRIHRELLQLQISNPSKSGQESE